MIHHELNVVKYTEAQQQLAASFCSGNPYLDRFLRGRDALDDSLGKTFVFLSQDNSTIIGYYNIGTGYIEMVEDGTAQKLGGSVHINCFALDEKYHGLLQQKTEEGDTINLSDVLLDDCIQYIEALRQEYIGFAFVTLSSTQEGYHLYKRNGFEELEDDMNFSVEASDIQCIPMYLALDLE